MITIKSPREIEIMKTAGRICDYAQRQVAKAIRPGVSTKELDEIAHKAILSHNAIPSFLGYQGFPAAICASVNEVVIHGIPSRKHILKNGDIISIDIGVYYNGYHGDCARTYPVGTISDADQALIDDTEASFWAGLAYAKPGNHLSDISHAVGAYATSKGYGVVKEFAGHGVGQALHEDPSIPNFGEPGMGPKLRPGMVLAIEPMINAGHSEIQILSDGWTVKTRDRKRSAHYENTIVITDTGYEILTTGGDTFVEE